jgi:hypothetical protein
MLELTATRARQLMRRTVNPATRDKMWAFLQAAAVERANARAGIMTHPADYQRHVHSFHQWVLGYVTCSGCGLRLRDDSEAAAA